MTDYAAFQKALVNAALVGAAQRPPNLPAPAGDLGHALSAAHRPTTDNGPRQLLTAASLYAGLQLAGAQPHPLPPGLLAASAAPADSRPLCSPRATHYLSRFLAGDLNVLLPVWLELADRAGQRPPPEHLPALLDYGVSHSHFRPVLQRVIGPPGLWLADYDPKWSYLIPFDSPAEIEQRWRTSDHNVRKSLLDGVRAVQPDLARQLVQATWKEEPAPHRVLYVKSLKRNLSLADEPLLETCLDDRSVQLRRAAAELLATLPGSAYVQRMLARVEPLLTLASKDGKTRIKITLPTAVTADMARDGVEEQAEKRSTYSGGAWWLRQMLETIPARHWTERWNQSAPDLLALSLDKKWGAFWLGVWRRTLYNHPDPEWALAILNHEPMPSSFINHCHPADAEALILRLLTDSTNLRLPDPGLTLLSEYDHPLSDGFVRQFLSLIVKQLAKQETGDHYALRDVFKGLAHQINPSLISEIESTLMPVITAEGRRLHIWHAALDEMFAVFNARATLQQEFAP